MTDKTVKVGNVVAWDEVPINTLIQWEWSGYGHEYHVKCLSPTGREKTACVGNTRHQWSLADKDSGNFDPQEPVVIVAPGLTGRETADELRALAERFEIRRHLIATGDDALWFGEDVDACAARLHACGWRVGMDADEAFRRGFKRVTE